MAAVMAAAFWIAAPLVVQIDSPEIPGLGPALEASGVLVISGGLFAWRQWLVRRCYCAARTLARQLALGFATSLGGLAGAGLGSHR